MRQRETLSAQLVNIPWWVWLVATLAVLGYFARLFLGIIQHGLERSP